MAGKVKLITRGPMLAGRTVNRSQWNPTAGLGRSDDAPPVKKLKAKKQKPQKRQVAKVRLPATADDFTTCGVCGAKVLKIRIDRHLRRVHGGN